MLLVSTLLIQPFWVVLLFQSFAIDLHSATLLSSRFVHDTQGRPFILNQFFEKCLAAPDAARKCVSSSLWLVCYKQAVYSSSSSHYLRVQRMTASGEAPDIFNLLILDEADSECREEVRRLDIQPTPDTRLRNNWTNICVNMLITPLRRRRPGCCDNEMTQHKYGGTS